MEDKDKALDPKPEPLFQIKRLAREYVQLSEIQEDPLSNNRAFRKAMAEGKHPLSNVMWEMETCIREDPETAWKAIVEMVGISRLDATLAFIAAGPIEDLLVKNSKEFIERIEKEAKKNAQFRKCLSMVWQNTVSDDIWQRIEKACKNL